MDDQRSRPDARQRLTVDQAAQVLGLSVDAVRSRVKRDSIPHTREGGRVWVLLDADQGATSHDQQTDQASAQDRTAELIATLREQLAQANERDRENRRIIAALTQRVPAIEASNAPVATDSPAKGSEQQDRGDAPQQPQAASPRPWWRRVFGG